MPDVLPALRDHLATEGIVREPRTAGAVPPLWLDPRRGAPAPGEGSAPETDAEVVLAAFLTGGVPPEFGEGYSRRDVVDLHIRTTRAPRAKQLEEQLVAELAPAPYGARFAWDLAGLFVIESRMWRALQPLTHDEQSYTFVVAFLIETYRA